MNLNKHPTIVIDLVGGGLLLAWVGAILSMSVLRDDALTGEIKNLRGSIAAARQNLTVVQRKLDASRAQLRENRELLRDSGKLPETAPVEEYFQFLSTMADQHKLRILSHYPNGERNYPGLRERRFSYVISGSLPRIVDFFQAVESSNYWADIGYLTIRPPRATGSEDHSAREAQLTICLFSAEPATSTPGTEG